ncbi:MAG: hypothetical protein COB51_13275 [Moraxellaceae bacterium]|nr:MAG: hypothetical protein COB51_13275 [Moraxellaceae bacterium]
MKQLIFRLMLCAVTFGVFAQNASAVPMLTFAPLDQSVELGDQVSVDVIVTGLSSEFVGDFDFFVEWDAGLLSLDSLIFGDALDDGLGFSFQDVDSGTMGTVNAAELAFGGLFNQDGFSDITLFTLTFDTLALGVSALDFLGNIGGDSSLALGDGFGGSYLSGFDEGSITITANVPEPGQMALFAIGLIGLGFARRRADA